MTTIIATPDVALPKARVTQKHSFHIAFCVDNHYFRSMGATIASIAANNPGRHFTFHVFAFSLTHDQRRRLRKLEENKNIAVVPHVIDRSIFNEFSELVQSSYISLSTFTRLIVPSLLKNFSDQVLYLDADMLCVGSIDELAAMDISDTIALVISDVGWTTRGVADGRYTTLNLPHKEYFNAGVIYINIKKWEENRISNAAIEALLKYGKKLEFNDQDALNIVLNGRARYIDKKWNYIYSLIADLKQGKLAMDSTGDAVFIHFAGAIKPWNDWSTHNAREMFKKYHALSPWSDMSLDQAPLNYKEMRIFARLLLKQGQIDSGVRWYAKYLFKSFARKAKK